MKVLNLRCGHGHLFEGWFASEGDFLDQNGRGLIECPMCADKLITRMPSAPRLNLSHARSVGADGAVGPAKPEAAAAAVASPQSNEATMQAHFLNAVRQVLSQTEDVGHRFPEEARRIHHGEIEPRGIRGQATPEERAALADEGIEVMPLPLPSAWKGRSH
jgi:hypothetical protein